MGPPATSRGGDGAGLLGVAGSDPALRELRTGGAGAEGAARAGGGGGSDPGDRAEARGVNIRGPASGFHGEGCVKSVTHDGIVPRIAMMSATIAMQLVDFA